MTKIAYIRDADNIPYGTVAFNIEQDSNLKLTINYATAWCSPADAFVKKVGRAKAAGRLLSERFRETFTMTSTKSLSEFTTTEWQLVTRAVLEQVKINAPEIW